MKTTVEKKLQKLENEIKALKATYMISSGAMKTYLSYSPVFTITDAFEESPIKVKFTAGFGYDKAVLVSSFFIEQTTTSGSILNLSQYAVNYEQSGDGTVIFEIPLLVYVSTVKVGIASTVPGTFTRIT